MCLAVPMKIIARDGDTATVEAGGVRYPASLRLLPQATTGDFVLVHAGFAIQKLDVADAEETLRLLQEMDAMVERAENE
jgi:hydrogenase expression/formation protein HypC